MRFLAFALSTVLAGAFPLPALADPVLYFQPSQQGGLSASQDAGGSVGNFATAYDDFDLPSGCLITSVQWTGSFFNGGPAAIASFAVNFLSDAAGQPGAVLSAFTISGDAGQTLTSASGNFYGPEYAYTGLVSFTAAADTRYWVSIVPTVSLPPQWGWDLSSQGDRSMYEDFKGTRTHSGYDLAFALSGHALPTPEPSSLMLAGSGLLGFAAAFRMGVRRS